MRLVSGRHAVLKSREFVEITVEIDFPRQLLKNENPTAETEIPFTLKQLTLYQWVTARTAESLSSTAPFAFQMVTL
jgi:hypothetical protein